MKIPPIWLIATGSAVIIAGAASGYYFWTKSQNKAQAWNQPSFSNEIIVPTDNTLANTTNPTNNNQVKKPATNNTQNNSTPANDDTTNDPSGEDSDSNSSSNGYSPSQTPWEQGPSDQ